jgi:hypothetical protein
VQPFQFPTSEELAHVAPRLAALALVEPTPSPSTLLETEYLMTLYLPLERPLSAADNLKVWNIRSEGSWLKGPGITARIVSPSGDWARVRSGGQIRVDVRLTLETEDRQVISMFYNGIVQMNGDALQRVMRGEAIAASEAYFVIAPTFETRSEKYSWLNGVQAVGKMVSFRGATTATSSTRFSGSSRTGQLPAPLAAGICAHLPPDSRPISTGAPTARCSRCPKKRKYRKILTTMMAVYSSKGMAKSVSSNR